MYFRRFKYLPHQTIENYIHIVFYADKKVKNPFSFIEKFQKTVNIKKQSTHLYKIN